MTTDIERQFFDTFGIPQLCCKEYITNCLKYGECEECKNYDSTFSTYPQITDRILLELICIAQSRFDLNFRNLCFDKIENLKYAVLDQILEYENRKYNHSIKHQVQTLFKEGE